MKILRFLIGLVSMLAVITGAQSQRSIHLSGGVDFSSVSFQGPQVLGETEHYTGYHVGVNVQQQLGDRWSLNLASQYVLRGYSARNVAETAHKRTYIDVQPELGYRVSASTEISMGGYYGILLTDHRSIAGGPWQDLQEIGLQDKNDIGLTLSVTQSVGPVVIYARYKHGLRKLNEIRFTDAVGNEVGTETEQNRQLQLGIGYRFDM